MSSITAKKHTNPLSLWEKAMVRACFSPSDGTPILREHTNPLSLWERVRVRVSP